MNVSILASDLSSNAMGRVLVLAQVLARRHTVEVIGPMYGDEVWPPIAAQDLRINPLNVDRSWRALAKLRRLSRMVSGDVLYACKPLSTSLGVALRARRGVRRPLLLDIDDWEWGFARQAMRSARSRMRFLAGEVLRADLPHAWPNVLLHDRMVARADAITVSNSPLQQRYGGTIVWHGRDTDRFSPERYPRADMRARLGIADREKVIMFFGTIQPYKGVDDLVAAVNGIPGDHVRLALVGAGDKPSEKATIERAQSALGSRLLVFGPQPFDRVPEFLAAADVVVVPQRRSVATEGQMPAKLFDAMAMARPTVSSAVTDIPTVLGECGWVVEPDSPPSLAKAISEALGDATKAQSMGEAARHRCVELYSFDAMERALDAAFQSAGIR